YRARSPPAGSRCSPRRRAAAGARAARQRRRPPPPPRNQGRRDARAAYAPGMEQRDLGSSGRAVPVVGLGTWLRFEAAAGGPAALVERALDEGVRVFDSS